MPRFLLVIKAADRDRANADALAFDPVGGDQTFTAGLSPAGQVPATHYWASGVASAATFDAIAAKVAAEYPGARFEAWDADVEVGRPTALLAEIGLTPCGDALHADS